jgi:uncharacterized protein YkwD
MPRVKPTHATKHVKRHLKHWFVPHKHNDHRPHLIRPHGLTGLALVLISVQIIANLFVPQSARVLGYATNITVADLLAQTNQERANVGLPALHLNAKLNQAASLKAGNMFTENYWAHVSPSGIQPWYWFTQAGYTYTYAGENLAKDFATTSGVMQGWMNSPGHKANVLNANYVDVGFAVQNGTLVGGQTTLVVAHYGTTPGTAPAATPAAAPAPAAPAPPTTLAPTPPATPAPSIAPTPTPSATASPSPSASPSPTPVVAGQVTPGAAAPPPKSYSLFAPLSILPTLNWQTLITIGLLLILLGVYVATHLAVWRKGLRRWKTFHYKLYAAGQVSGLTAVIVLLGVSGFGKVG